MARTFKIGVFDDEGKFISTIRSLQEHEYQIFDVFTPYPVHDVFHLLKRKSRLPTAAYFLGLFGIIATLAFLYYTSVIDWPLVYGGKPFNSFPSFIVVTIVVTILSARSKLFPGRDNTIFDLRATDDKFIIVVESNFPDISSAGRAGNIMEEQGAIEVFDKEFENVET